MQVPIEKISDFVLNAELFFDKNLDQLKKVNIKDFKDFKKIMNPENISRKECLLLPFKTLSKALKL
jgi:nitrogen fixation NifU-like protein